MNNKKTILIIALIVFVILIIGTIIAFIVLPKDEQKVDNSNSLYNQELYIDATLPSISGSENVTRDEFLKKTNVSELLKNDKVWMELTFTNFNVYSLRDSISTIEFDIVNNTNYLIESSKFQFQILGENLQILSLINFDEVVMPQNATCHVTVNVTGDVTNLKDIKVDDINYTMKVGDV